MGLRLGVLGSLCAHAAALFFLLRLTIPALATPSPPAELPVGVVVVTAAPPSNLPQPVPIPAGPGDVAVPLSTSPLPRADLDNPEPTRAALGGGRAMSGVTGRHDREDLRAQIWNDPTRYQIPRVATSAQRATSEALARLPEPEAGAQEHERARRARRPRPGAGATAAEPVAASRPEAPLVAHGAPAVDAAHHGAVSDDVTTSQASNQRDPEPFDLTRPSAIDPRRPDGPSAVSDHGAGDGASRDDVDVGHGPVSSRARLQDPYFHTLTARVMERVVWPRRLAMTFEQGEVIVRFTLGPAGSVDALAVERTSGHPEFDDAVVTAIKAASPFGPPPAALLGHGRSLQVSAPFVFDNPMIR